MFAKLAGFLLLSLAFGAGQADADSVYKIIGTLTAPGNSSNPGVSETINYSFMLDFQPTGVLPTILGASIITSFGPLGSFTIGPGRIATDYVPFYSVSGGEIDLFGSFFLSPQGPVVAPTSGMWSCNTRAACTVFYPDRLGGAPVGSQLNSAIVGWAQLGTASASVYAVTVPEPGTLCLSVLGALALYLMKQTLTP